jgi:hypothetical protein
MQLPTFKHVWNYGRFHGWSVFATILVTGSAIAAASNPPASVDTALPEVRVENIRRAFHNGEHNAFTDLVRFKGRYYLTFRSCPDGHMVHPSSSILVLSSLDSRTWEPIHRFQVAKRDVRDPHFLVFRDRLMVFTGTWYCGEGSPKEYTMNQHLGYAAWSEDGSHWQGPKLLEGTYGHYIWRAATDGRQAFLCGRRIKEFADVRVRKERDQLVESAMLVSDDGLVWKTAGLFQEEYGDETAFQMEPDSGVLAVCRSGSMRNAQVCRAQPPYQHWERTELDRYIGGPLLVQWQRRSVVAGRKIVQGKATTSFYWLENRALHEFVTLPSGGDNSYPGFVELDSRRALVSWYSSHEKDAGGKTITAIYLAELVVK